MLSAVVAEIRAPSRLPEKRAPRHRNDAPDPFDVFFRSHVARARRWAILLGVPERDVEDVVQDAVLSLWEHRESVAREAWSVWLRRAVVIRRLRLLRSRRRARVNDPEYMWLVSEHWSARRNPERELHLQEVEAALQRLLRAVKSSRRDVAERFLIEGQSLEEIAFEMGIPVGTAKRRWSLAQQDMRAAFGRALARAKFRGVRAEGSPGEPAASMFDEPMPRVDG